MAMTQANSKGAGSPTNASDAVDDVRLPSKPTTDQKMDAGVKETFPASDPVSPAAGPGKTKTDPEAPAEREAGGSI